MADKGKITWSCAVRVAGGHNKTGAEVTSPDCDKTSATARLPGVTAGGYGTCAFTSRASLESALKAQATQPWKINLTYKYE